MYLQSMKNFIILKKTTHKYCFIIIFENMTKNH